MATLCLLVFSCNGAFAYDVWLGLPYFPKGADTTLKDQWELTAQNLDGLNPNLSQTKTPVAERITNAEWRKIIALMPKAKNNAMAPMPRTHFNYGTRTDKGTLPEYLTKIFRAEQTYGYKIKWVMPYNEQPNEDRTLPVYSWSDAELQELRDWLDNNGRASTRIMYNVRNNGQEGRNFVEKALVSGYSIEARARLWFENTGNRPAFLRWAVSNPVTKDKHAKFQMPFGGYDDTAGRFGPPSNMTGYQAMRRCMRWLVTDVLNGNTELFRRDDVTFLSIVYDPTNKHFPEKTADGSQYVDGTTSVLLSIMEQKALFDGTAPGGLISIEQAMSYDRITIPTEPDAPVGPKHGLVAHWPLDEGSGVIARDVSALGASDGSLLNGASWGSDGTRASYVSFDGTNDRISTPFRYALSDTDNFTWAWWARRDPTANGGSIMVGNRYGGTGSESFEFIKFMPNKASFANTNVVTSIEDHDYSDIPANAWNHYAMVKTGKRYQWYVNGVRQGNSVTINYNESSPLPFFIGGDDDGTGTRVNEHFKGSIDDVVLYRSALTAQDVRNVRNGIYDLTVTMVALGTAVDSTAASTWSNGVPPHSGANYMVPATGNLRGETGTTIFPGSSLTVQAGGRFQVRAIDGSDETTTVNNLILSGGASFAAGQFAELAAGTGTNVTNLLDGTITQSGATRLLTNGGSIARSLKIASRIDGTGTLQLVGQGAIISNADNTFSGNWEVENGATLTFNNAGSVGTADIDVRGGGSLRIEDHWAIEAELTVADTPTTSVDIGNFTWAVSNLTFGGSSVEGGTYTASALNALGSNAVFTGSGIVRVMPEGSTFQSIVHNTEGTIQWVCPPGITSIQVECWGGGGAGGSSSSTGAAQVYVAGGGAAGGAYAKKSIVPVTPGRTYTLRVAPAAVALNPATASTGARSNGADTSFTGDNGVTVRAKGGQGGQSVINPTVTRGGVGGVGSVTGSISDGSGYVFAGGTGNYPLNKGGAGGGGAGSSEEGGDAFLEDAEDEESVSLPGNGGLEGGGEGGSGANFVANGGDGSSPGGGGGGARTGRFTASSGNDLQKTGGKGGLGQIKISYLVLPVSLTNREKWRVLYFSTTDPNTLPAAADNFDPNRDGENNLLEFATGQDPHANTLAQTSLTKIGDNLVFRYTRSKDAMADGMQFSVQWSDTLRPDSWSVVGDLPDAEKNDTIELEHRVATIPAGPSGRRFVQLKVSAP